MGRANDSTKPVDDTNGIPIHASNGHDTTGVHSIPIEETEKGPFGMSWQNVVAIALFVAGACVLGAIGQPMIGATLAGAAAGFALKEAPRRRK